jgi:molybdopterin-guanine dinucleotide biosynthesis protein A
MLVSISGHAQPVYKISDFSFAPGDTPNLHKDLAKAWIASGVAEPYKAAAAEQDDAATEPAESAAEQDDAATEPAESAAEQQDDAATEPAESAAEQQDDAATEPAESAIESNDEAV